MEKTHGKRGEVVTVPVHGLPPMLREGLEVFVVPPALKGPRSLMVREADLGRSGQLVALEGVTGIGEAERLVGHALLARVDDLPEGFEAHDVDALLGREVVDEKSGLSALSDTDLRSLMTSCLEHTEVLLPAVESVVVDASGEGPIRVLAPEGLLEGGE